MLGDGQTAFAGELGLPFHGATAPELLPGGRPVACGSWVNLGRRFIDQRVKIEDTGSLRILLKSAWDSWVLNPRSKTYLLVCAFQIPKTYSCRLS